MAALHARTLHEWGEPRKQTWERVCWAGTQVASIAVAEAANAEIFNTYGDNPEAAVAALNAACLVDEAGAASMLSSLVAGKSFADAWRQMFRRCGAARLFFQPVVASAASHALVCALEGLRAALEAAPEHLELCGTSVLTALDALLVRPRTGESRVRRRCLASNRIADTPELTCSRLLSFSLRAHGYIVACHLCRNLRHLSHGF